MKAAAAVLVMAMAGSACGRDDATAATKEFEFGAHRLQVTVPSGWEALDQGRQKRFRHTEFTESQIVLQNLGAAAPPPTDFNDLVDWGLAEVGHDKRREVKSRRTVTLDGREAMDIETWNRLDHTNPQRIFLVRDDTDLLALHTVGMVLENSLAAFEAIRQSLHFVSDRR